MEDVLAGRKEEYALLVRAHQGKVRSLCLSLLHNPSQAEDAAQDIFLKAYRNLKGFRFDSSFSTWLYRISYRHCLDLRKSEKRRRAEPLDALGQGPAAPPEDDPARVEEILSSLPPEYRLILTLREVQGLTYDEIARALGASLDSVKAKLRRARLSLQERARHLFTGETVQSTGGTR